MARKMPAEDYAFRPVPEVETFVRRAAHITGANLRTCEGLKGETKSLDLGSKTTKADLLAALEQSFAYCDGLFESLTDSDSEKWPTGWKWHAQMAAN